MSQTDKINSIIDNLQDTIKELESLKAAAPETINVDSTPKKEESYCCQPYTCCSCLCSSGSWSTPCSSGSCCTCQPYSCCSCSCSSGSCCTCQPYSCCTSSTTSCCSTVQKEDTCKVDVCTSTACDASSGFFSESLNPSWPSLKWLKGDLSGMHLKTRGLVLTDNGKKIICPPYRYGRPLEIDIENETIEYTSGLSTGFVGHTEVSNGKQVINPAYANGFSVYSNDKQTWVNNIGHKWQIRGTAEGEAGIIYGPQFVPTPTNKLVWLDTNTYKFGVVEGPSDRKKYSFNGAWGAVGAKGRVFILPFSSPYVGFVEKGEKKNWVELKDTKVVGNGTSHTMYTHGRYHEKSNLIVSLPRRSNAVLTINPDTLDVTEVPLPQELIDLFPTGSKSFDCEIGPDGWIYSSPWAHPVIFRFNPSTNEFDWKDLLEELMPARRSTSGPHPKAAWDGYFTAMKRINNEIYYGVAGGRKGLKLVF